MIINFKKKVLVGTMLLAMVSSMGAFASESQSIDPKNVEIPMSAEITSDFGGELDPTTILNMEGLLPDDSEITALNKVPIGEGSIIESESTGDVKTPEGKEFYIIQTGDEQVFYLVIDHAKSSDNVYFLNQVNADDIKNNTSTNISADENKNTEKKEILQEDSKDDAPTPENEEVQTNKANNDQKENSDEGGSMFFYVIIMAGVFGAGYYVKIYKPKKKVLDDALDLENDFEGVNYSDDDGFYEEDMDEDEEELEEEEQEEWEEPVVKQNKRKPAVQESKKAASRNTTATKIEQPKQSKIGSVFGLLGKLIFGSILVCLVSLGLTVLTNESLRNIIMETIKNYF